jgi:cell division protein ZapA (FtsZ GTPase activity inhibitor)
MIIKIVNAVNNLYELDCTTDTRRREIVIPRQIAMYFIHKNLNVSLAVNGRYFKRDHATVLHAVKCVNNIITSKGRIDDTFKENIKELDREIKRTLRLSDEEIKKLDIRDEILLIIENYNLFGLNYLKSKLVIMPN